MDVDSMQLERWGNGVTVFPYPPDVPGSYNSCAPASEQPAKGEGSTIATPDFDAITIWLAESCTAAHVWDQEMFKARATAALAATASYALEYEFLTGEAFPLNPHLSDGEGTFPNGSAPTNVVNGLALLEAAIAASGRMGVIHCSPQFALAASARLAIDDSRKLLRTINGTPVIPGAGYVESATPTGKADPTGPGQEWIYATGPIDIRQSEVFTLPDTVGEAMDRSSNKITYRAEQHFVVDWDDVVHTAVLADRFRTDP